MSVETEAIKLRPFEISMNGDKSATLIRSDGEQIEVPADILSFFRYLSGSTSIAELAVRTRQSAAEKGQAPWGRYARLAKFLSFLYDCGLLVEQRTIQLAEGLRPDYVWRESIAMEELGGLELFRLRGGKALPQAFRVLVFVVLLSLVPALLFRAPGVFREVLSNWPKLESAWPVVLAFLVAFTVARSVRALIQFCLIRLLTGGGGTLRLRVDAVSVSLATDDSSKAQMNGPFVTATLAALTALAVPAVFEAQLIGLGLTPEAARFLPFFTLLLLLVDLSPFRKSALTECLRAIYVYLDRREQKGLAESTVRNLHVASCVVWVVSFGLFLVVPLVRLAFYIRESEFLGSRPGLASAGVLFLILITVLVSLIDDIVSGIGDGGGTDRHSIRRLWRRREVLRRAGDSALTRVDGKSLEERMPSPDDLARLPFLRQMDASSRELLLGDAKVVDLEAGELVCRQGDDDRTLYILLTGRLAVARRNLSARRKVVAYLEPGAVFGEVAFFFGDRRTADVVVLENSRLLAIRHNEKLAMLDRNRSEELRLRIWFLQSLVASPLFKQLPSDALDALLFAGEKMEFPAGGKVISEGEVGDACYFIVQGKATVIQNLVPINRLQPGDAFGEIALLNPQLLRTASVVADTEILTVAVGAKRFMDLLDSHLPLALEVERLAEARLRQDAARRSS